MAIFTLRVKNSFTAGYVCQLWRTNQHFLHLHPWYDLFFYRFFNCILVWKTDLNLYRPKSWLLGYWLVASLVWMVFLVISLFHMRNGRELAMQARASNCFKKTYSTEDLWNEDSYIPEHIGSFHEFHYARFIGKWKNYGLLWPHSATIL